MRYQAVPSVSIPDPHSLPQTNLQDTLRVPPHLLHPADLEQANPATPEEVATLRQEVEGLRQELLNVREMGDGMGMVFFLA